MRLVDALAIAGLMAVHLFGARLRFLDVIPRSRWLSVAGGVSVAYVFLHVLPELSATEAVLARTSGAGLLALEQRAYVVALVGLMSFYGLERLVRSHRRETAPAEETGVFWLHIAAFAAYNVVIGHVLVQEQERDPAGYLLFALALALHVLVVDFGLRQDHSHAYARRARWILVAALLAGWIAGMLLELPEPLVVAVTAFLAGAIILNVMKEELPEERESRFGAFALGAAGYAMLLATAA